MKSNAQFYAGVAVVIGSLIRDYDQPSMAADICRSNGIELEHFKGVDAFDLKPIRKMYRDEFSER